MYDCGMLISKQSCQKILIHVKVFFMNPLSLLISNLNSFLT